MFSRFSLTTETNYQPNLTRMCILSTRTLQSALLHETLQNPFNGVRRNFGTSSTARHLFSAYPVAGSYKNAQHTRNSP
jgi:hypothetical protein